MTPRWLDWGNPFSKEEKFQPHDSLVTGALGGETVAGPEMYRPIAIWSEKISECGEDAEPIVFISEDKKFGMAAVFDGLGGSGAGRFDLGGKSYSGARLAASIARKSLIETVCQIWLSSPGLEDALRSTRAEEVMNQGGGIESYLPVGLRAELSKRKLDTEGDREPTNTARASLIPIPDAVGRCFTFTPLPNPSLNVFDSATLGRSFDSSFAAAFSQLGAQAMGSRLKGRAKRHLPTTFAGVFFSEREGKISLKVFWAGDSRVYFLCGRGLFQLTIDHARANSTGTLDPSGDAPMTRVISEHTPNEIDSCYEPHIMGPGFVIACTDGAYGYFATAVHFELALWAALERPTPTEQAKALTTAIGRVTQDDASIAIIPVGFQRAGTLVTSEHRLHLDSLQKEFEEGVAALQKVKPHVAMLEAKIEKMRSEMQASPRSVLSRSGELLR